MATTAIWGVKGWLGRVVVYVENPDKTENPKFFEMPDMDELQTQGLADVIDYAVQTRKTVHAENEEVIRQDDYSIEAIRKRILAQSRPERIIIPADPPKKYVIVRGNIHRARKLTGLRALYFYYLYRIGVLPRKRQPNPKQVYFLFREDIRHMQDMAREIRLLAKYGINTAEQLAAHKDGANAQIAELSGNRKHLRNQTRSIHGEDRLAAVKSKISELTAQITELRREVRLCENIETRSLDMKDKIHRAKEAETAEKSKTKEMMKREPFRGRR